MTYDFDSLFGEAAKPSATAQPPEVAPPPGAGGYDFEALFTEAPRAPVEASLYEASFGNPDEEAQRRQAARDLERFLGDTTPPAILDLPDAQRRLRAAEADHATRASPRTSAWLSSVENARIAADDAKTLAGIEKILDGTANFGRAVKKGAIFDAPEAFWGALSAPGEVAQQALKAAGLPEWAAKSELATLFRGLASLSKAGGEAVPVRPGETTLERGLVSGAESLGQSLVTLPAGVAARSAEFSTRLMALLSGGSSYLDARAEGESPLASLSLAVPDAVAEYTTERFGMDALFNQKAFRNAFLKQASVFAAKEMAGEQVATVWQDFNRWMVLNPEKSVGEFMAERPDAAVQTAIATLVGAGGQVAVVRGLQAVLDQEGAGAQAEAGAQNLEQLFKLASESLTKQRDADSFASFFQSVAPDASVFVNPQTLREALAAAGVPETALPSLAAQPEADNLSPGVEIPITELVTALAGTGAETALIPHLRLDPDAPTLAEVQANSGKALEFFQQEAAKALEQAGAQEEFHAAAETVHDDLLTEINAASPFGKVPGYNEGIARLTRDFYSTVASRRGVTPLQLRDGWTDAAGVQHRGYRLKPRGAAGPAGGLAQSFTPEGTTELDTGKTQAAERFASFAGYTYDGKTLTKDGTPIATLKLRVDGNRLVIDDIEAKQKGQGEGTAALQAIIAHAHSQGLTPVLFTDAMRGKAQQKRLRAYYARLGFVANKGADKIKGLKEEFYFPPAGGEFAQPAYHGSPYRFDKFSLEHLGKGEGAQAFGYGLYFAGRREIAEFYRENLSGSGGRGLSLAGVVPSTPDEGLSNAAWVAAKKLSELLVPKPGDVKAFGDLDVKGQGSVLAVVNSLIQDDKVLNAVVGLVPIDVVNMLGGKQYPADYLLDHPTVLVYLLPKDANDLVASGVEAVNVLAPAVALAAAKVHTGLSRFDVTPSDFLAADGTLSHTASKEITDKIPQPSEFAKGQLYEVEIPEDGEYLLWDKPLSEQPEKVRQQVLALIERLREDRGPFGDEVQFDLKASIEAPKDLIKWRGFNIYQTLSSYLGGDEAASKGLHELGIAGIKYADATARGKTEDSFNYVIFDENAVQIAQTFYQQQRDQQRAAFSPATLDLTLLANADLSSYLHELGHFFLTVYGDLAAQPDAPADIRADMDALLKWFGITGAEPAGVTPSVAKGFARYYHGGSPEDVEGALWFTSGLQDAKGWASRGEGMRVWYVDVLENDPVRGGDPEFGVLPPDRIELPAEFAKQRKLLIEPGAPGPLPEGRTPLEIWNSMNIDQQRPFHERMAESFEQYLFTGKAPTKELQPLFRRLASWMGRVYGTIREFLASHGGAQLNPEVSAVFDRMLATDAEIAAMKEARAYTALFRDAAEAGMSPADFAAYQALDPEALEDAEEQLRTRGLRDMKWLQNRRNKVIAELQEEAKEKRAEVMIEARREVMTQPLYRAWQFLTGKITAEDRISPPPKVKSDPNVLDETVDSLFAAIAKLGGLRKDEVLGTWGIDPADKPQSGVFSKPVWRLEGGLSLDGMAEALGERGYLTRDEHGKVELAEFELLFGEELRGVPQYSNNVDPSKFQDMRPGEQLANPAALLAGKFDRGALRTLGLPVEFLDHLENLRMVAANGLHPDIVADLFEGFTSGEDLVRQLLAAHPPKTEIEGLTDRYMLERYGDLSSSAAIERAADEALHNDLRTRMVATEMWSLDKRVGAPAVLMRAAREYARQVVATKSLKTLKPAAFAAAETRAGKAAAEALRKGDRAEAARQKRAELLNHAAAKEAYAGLRELEKKVARLQKIASGKDDVVGKTRDLDLVNTARAILAEFGIGARGEAAAHYLDLVEKNNPDLAAVLADTVRATTAGAKDYKTLSLTEMRELSEAVEAVWFLAKRSRQMEVDGKLVSRHEVEQALWDRLDAIGIPDRVPGEGSAVTPAEKRGMLYHTFLAALRRVESWAGAMDGSQPMGPFRRYVFAQIKDAADRYRSDKARVLKAYRDLLANVGPGLERRLIEAPEIGYTFGKSEGGMGKVELLHAILHTGNASNKRKLLLGRRWGAEDAAGEVDTSKWDAFLARMVNEGVLTKADFDFAQGVWDLLESLKPLAQKTHRDVFGRYFAEVTADSFTDPFGVLRRGGYVPAMADPDAVLDADLRALAEAENENMKFAFPTPAKGFTKARVEYNRPLKLDLRTLTSHIDKVLLFSHLTQPVNDVRRVLSSKQVGQALGRVDPAAVKTMLTPWLNRAAKQVVEARDPADAGTGRFWAAVRARAGMAAMFANVANAAQQITGLSLAAVRVKPRHLMEALAHVAKAPRQTAEWVAEQSLFMEQRMRSEVDAMSGEINDILINPNVYQRGKEWTRRHAYFLQSAVDNVISPVVWLGAYNQALEQGQTERDAIRLADATVRETQGANTAEDVAKFETGSAFYRMFTQFAGYFNMNANLLGSEFAKIGREMGLKKGAGRGLYVLVLGFFAPAMVGELIMQAFKGGPDDEDDDGVYLDDWLAHLFSATLRYGTAMIPVGGQTANAIVNRMNDKPYDDRMSTAPAISMAESAINAPFALYKAIAEEGKPSRAIKDVATLLSLTLGVPASGMARPISYLADVEADRVEPTGPVDLLRGTITGVASPESKQ